MTIKTLARLSFWLPAVDSEDSTSRKDDFAEVWDRRLAPLLEKHGLVSPMPGDRLAVPGVSNRLFEVEGGTEIAIKDRGLRGDAAWQAALQELKCRYGIAVEEELRYRLELYSAPAGPGQVESVGQGFRQGLWQTFGIPDGMPSCISTMLQDRQGALWLGAGWLKQGGEWGVFRYDGARLRRFTTADGLANNRVRALLEDRQGRLWFGTFGGGVSCYDGTKFENYSTADGLADDVVFSLLEDCQGRLWIGTNDELSRFDGRQFETFTSADGLVETLYTTDGLGRIGVSSLLEDRRGVLWVGTWGGLSRFDGRRFETFTAADGLANNWVRCLLEDRRGDLWVGTGVWDSGSGRMEQKGGVSRWTDGGFETFTSVDGLASGMVRCLLEDRQKDLWVGTWGGGLSRFDGRRFETFTTADGLANNQIFSLLEDRSGYLWVGTVGGGMSRYDNVQVDLFTTADGLPSNGVMSLLLSRKGDLWIGTWEGVASYDGELFVPLEGLAGKNVHAIVEDRRGDLWFATNGDGVMRFDGKEIFTYTSADGLAYNEVRDLLEDGRGNLWAATNRGVGRYDGAGWSSFSTTDGLAHNEVRGLLEDRRGDLWFVTDGGVSRFDGHAFVSFTMEDGLGNNCVMCVLEDREGRLWFGTDGGGMSCYDGECFKNYTPADGLCHDQVHSILQDREGHLWFATYGGGVARYDGLTFQQLTRRDGLAHDAVQQILQDRRGDFWIATEGGITRYRSQDSAPEVYLTEIIADRHYGPVNQLNLSVSQQVLLFRFQGASLMTRANGMVYVYRLEGYDEGWQVAYEGLVEYPQLPVGDYTFQVKAVDRDLNYSEAVEVRITVEPDPRLEGLSEALNAQGPGSEFVGTSAVLRQVQTQLAQVAPTEVTVLILGETGTGKGLAARALHGMSGRKAGLCLQVNCGGLPSGLIESELFGHERGAFTGATRRKLGLVELAAGGTLFLDEIGDLIPEAQVKLLQVLEEGTFSRVGGTEVLSADVRVVAATNRDLQQMVAEGRFREDLFFRLQGFTVHLPPLRERREDIPLLASYFMEGMAAHLNKRVSGLTPEVLDALQTYDWLGNVRELEQAIKRGVIVCPGPVIRVEDLALEKGDAPEVGNEVLITPEEYERQYILQLLERTGWVIRGPKGAAALWGVPEGTLRSRMKKHGIQRPGG